MKQIFLLLFLGVLSMQHTSAQTITFSCGRNTIYLKQPKDESHDTVLRSFFTDSMLVLRLSDFGSSGEINKWQLLFTYKGRGKMAEFLPFVGNNSLVIPDIKKYVMHNMPVSILITVTSASKKTMKVMVDIVDSK